ncbi:MAG: cyclic nucleotide-binding domain-containing protein [Hydrogenophaga sp.]|nr:cyclic nucleotide-binding domain-containing protein [Hydrogenophaga sp.]
MTSTVSSVALDCASNQSIFLAGESGPVWRVVEGVVHLDRDSGPIRQPVQLALPGDLIGAESLCGQPYQLSASAFTRCRLEPVRPDVAPEPLLQQALLQQLDRSQDMAQLRSGSVQQRLTHLLGLMGLDRAVHEAGRMGQADAVREALPTLREVALLVDAKTETVCRALAQLLPPRSRKRGPVRAVRDWSNTAPARLATAWAANAAPLGVAA